MNNSIEAAKMYMNDLLASSDSRMASVNKTPVADGQFEVWEWISSGHKALHAVRAFAAGEVLAKFGARNRLKEPTYLSVQLNETQHILLDPVYLQYMNHSCSPNAMMDVRTLTVRALRPIQPGEELAFFYPATEWSMAQPFECYCNSPRCIGLIQGAAHLPVELLENYELSPHVKKLLKSRIPLSGSVAS